MQTTFFTDVKLNVKQQWKLEIELYVQLDAAWHEKCAIIQQQPWIPWQHIHKPPRPKKLIKKDIIKAALIAAGIVTSEEPTIPDTEASTSNDIGISQTIDRENADASSDDELADQMRELEIRAFAEGRH